MILDFLLLRIQHPSAYNKVNCIIHHLTLQSQGMRSGYVLLKTSLFYLSGKCLELQLIQMDGLKKKKRIVMIYFLVF